jgi:predicted Zn-dependent protease
LAPNSPDINDTLGTLYLSKGDSARAMEYFDKAKKLAPTRLDLRLNYAKALAATGKKDAARKEFEALQAEKADFRGKSEIAGLLKTL